jgi:ataxia telangiectasia mutated family protein
VFGSVLPTFKEILRSRIGNIAGGPTNAMDIDYSESFAPIRNAQATADSQKFGDASAARCVAEVCISSLAVIPVLESSSGEPTRDKELTELVLKCSDERFFLAARVFFTHVRQRILSLSPNGLQNFLDKFSSLVTSNYTYGRREEVLLLLIHFLRSTLRVWLQDNIYHTETGKNVSDLLHWLSHLIKNKTARSWRVRDAITVFFDDYLSQDPTQKFWRSGDDSSEGPDFEPSDILPATLIPHIAADDDIRVRFRAAVANARLFLIVERLNVDPMNLYRGILSCLTKDIDE